VRPDPDRRPGRQQAEVSQLPNLGFPTEGGDDVDGPARRASQLRCTALDVGPGSGAGGSPLPPSAPL
jgi:hypothetical protein